jgi:hypothetical protein
MDITDCIGYVKTMDYTDATDATENDENINYDECGIFFFGIRWVHLMFLIV